MDTIKLADAEIIAMRQFYREELEKTLSRLNHIKSVLDTLGGNGTSIQIQINSSKPTIESRDESAQDTSSPNGLSKRKSRRGPKGIWEDLIIKRLRQLDKPVTYDELTEEVMLLAKIPVEKRVVTKQAILSVVFRLRTRDHKLDTFSMGKREKYIALTSWFESPGVIKREYSDKIDLRKSVKKTISKGRGTKQLVY